MAFLPLSFWDDFLKSDCSGMHTSNACEQSSGALVGSFMFSDSKQQGREREAPEKELSAMLEGFASRAKDLIVFPIDNEASYERGHTE